MLKKEITKSQTDTGEKSGEYRQMLVQAVHTCAVKFPDVAGSVVHLLMDFLGGAKQLVNPEVGGPGFEPSHLRFFSWTHSD